MYVRTYRVKLLDYGIRMVWFFQAILSGKKFHNLLFISFYRTRVYRIARLCTYAPLGMYKLVLPHFIR